MTLNPLIRTPLFSLILILLKASVAFSEEIKPNLVWIDPLGTVMQNVASDTEFRISWAKKEPAMKLIVTLPKEHSFVKSSSPKLTAADAQRFEVEIDGYVTSLDVTLKRNIDNKEFNVALVIQIPRQFPKAYIHPSCKDNGLNIKTKKLGKTHLATAIRCTKKENYLSVDVVSIPTTNTDLTGRMKSIAKKSTFINETIRLKLLSKYFKNRKTLGELVFTNEESIDATIFALSYGVAKPPSKFFGGLGASLSLLSYKETSEEAEEVKLTQLAVTVKGYGGYALSPRFDFGILAFANLFSNPISADEGVPSSRFMGINGRLGWLAISTKEVDLRLMAGWYIWTMSVRNEEYGIGSASGPQIFSTLKIRKTHKNPMGFYLKFAPMLIDSDAGLMQNRELAFGMNYELDKKDKDHLPPSLGIDIALMKLSPKSPDRAISMFVLSGGITFPLKF